MTAEQLRNSILQEAISGRLVPQDPNDEPASALLARIREEKARLVKEGTIKAKDVLEYTIDDIPYELPDNWSWVKLGEISYPIKRGKSPVYIENSQYIAFAQKCNTKKGYIDLGLAKYIESKKAETQADIYLKLGDIVINSTGTGTLGRVGLFNVEYPENIIGVVPDSHVATVRLLSIYPEYAYYFLRTCQAYLESLGEGGTNQKELKPSSIAELFFPLPPLAEQKRIVAKLEELLPIVEQYGKAQTELDELNAALPTRLRQSILQEAVQGKLTSHDEKDDWAHNFKKQLPPLKIKSNPEWPTEFPFDLPESWEWCRVGDICDILNGYAFKSDKYVESGINVIRISNVQDGKIIDKDNKYVSLAMEKEIEDYMLREKDLLMSLTGNVGRVGLLPKSMLPAALNQRVACLRLKDESIKPFLLWYLQSPVFRERCESSGHGMAQLNISTEWLKQEYIPLPPLPEQQRIVAKIEELFEQIDKITK